MLQSLIASKYYRKLFVLIHILWLKILEGTQQIINQLAEPDFVTKRKQWYIQTVINVRTTVFIERSTRHIRSAEQQ